VAIWKLREFYLHPAIGNTRQSGSNHDKEVEPYEGGGEQQEGNSWQREGSDPDEEGKALIPCCPFEHGTDGGVVQTLEKMGLRGLLDLC
jgi:hypothetical protein